MTLVATWSNSIILNLLRFITCDTLLTEGMFCTRQKLIVYHGNWFSCCEFDYNNPCLVLTVDRSMLGRSAMQSRMVLASRCDLLNLQWSFELRRVEKNKLLLLPRCVGWQVPWIDLPLESHDIVFLVSTSRVMSTAIPTRIFIMTYWRGGKKAPLCCNMVEESWQLVLMKGIHFHIANISNLNCSTIYC